MHSVPIFQSDFEEHNNDQLANVEGNDNVEDGMESNEKSIKIDIEDVQDKINLWNSAIICYVIGANPPIHVMEGFFRRIWKSFNVDKVALIKRGVFLVRFNAMDSRDSVLNGHYFFDKKPLIMKPWSPDIDFVKEDIKTLPIWVQLRLPLKYWEENSLHKIVSQLGDHIKRDEATRNRDKLQFARILVEMEIEQKFPDHVWFMNEYGEKVKVPVEFEWLPTQCGKCARYGHNNTECRVVKPQQEWRIKKKNDLPIPVDKVAMDSVPNKQQEEGMVNKKSKEVLDPDGFQRALKPIKVRVSTSKSTSIEKSSKLYRMLWK
ncbi:uncharacterized protein LOC125491779 [Beta vulgaris subsp. vulgaris]|uniref:uncharacterized protein LOC125491779 n=1 Tax=Beta vulgaris subsp. vulgaris TaxID=3555 RepID=UPI002036F70B|nr:uncharacterized protein LOC125491779 [Beta vulgaris subsp. vulgaris]